jgi:ATPase subunit of ABC transporter with duplicated ATPase domains
MTIFTLRSIKKDFGIKELLTDASFSLDEGDKVGLIGTNGSGKSTLLKMIAWLGVESDSVDAESISQDTGVLSWRPETLFWSLLPFILQELLIRRGNV